MAGVSIAERVISNHKNTVASTQARPDVVAVGDFRIDIAARTATVRGRELRLTSVEFDVLVFLVGHPKNCITPHTMLMSSSTGGSVRQTGFLRAMLSLTRKLDAEAGATHHYIRTEPMILYRFEPDASSAS